MGKNDSLSMPSRVFPAVAGLVAWGLVLLVLVIILVLVREGVPSLSWGFVSQGVERGAFFQGGTTISFVVERGDGVTGEWSGPLATWSVQGQDGKPIGPQELEFYASGAGDSTRLIGKNGEILARSSQRGTKSPLGNATLELQLPTARDTTGATHRVSLVATNLPAESQRVEVSVLVAEPMRLLGLPSTWTELVPTGQSGTGPLEFGAWVPAKGAPIRIERLTTSGVFPMIVGTFITTLLMTLLCVPFGVMAAIYLHEYASHTALSTRIIRTAINNLAGVPSIVFGLFGLGFFISFLGKSMDRVFFGGETVYGQPCVLWASATLAVLTLPVVIVTTEEALRAIPTGLRMASLALGATKFQTVLRVVLPEALGGILTGMILAVSRGAGEVAPILFTGVTNFRTGFPSWAGDEKFMHLGYHVYSLATQSPDIERTRGLLFATVLALLGLTVVLNLVAVLIRARLAGSVGAHQ